MIRCICWLVVRQCHCVRWVETTKDKLGLLMRYLGNLYGSYVLPSLQYLVVDILVGGVLHKLELSECIRISFAIIEVYSMLQLEWVFLSEWVIGPPRISTTPGSHPLRPEGVCPGTTACIIIKLSLNRSIGCAPRPETGVTTHCCIDRCYFSSL